MANYIRKMRQQLGQAKFIHPAARIIIENEAREVLLVHKRNRDRLALPAGALEEGETIEQCIRREVVEETGLVLKGVQVIGVISDPEQETVIYPNGDVIQYFTVEFYSNQFEGQIRVNDEEEITAAAFYPPTYLDQILENEQSAVRSWRHFQATGQIRLG